MQFWIDFRSLVCICSFKNPSCGKGLQVQNLMYITFSKENSKDSLNEGHTNLENGRGFVFTGLEKKVSKAGLEKNRNFAITMNIF